ncbi:MAG: DUF917 family protein [Tenacibaculum sp.]
MITTIPKFQLKSFKVAIVALLIGFYSCTNNDPEVIQNDSNAVQQKSEAISENKSLLVKENIDKVNALISKFRRESSFKDLSAVPVKWTLTLSEIYYTYLGLAIKGSGGGGAFEDGLKIISKLNGSVEICDISIVDNNKLYIVAGGIGAPSAVNQRLDDLIESIRISINKLSSLKGIPVGGILSVESGPVNASIAMLLSKRLGIPLINADGAGRSVPKLSNLTYAHENYSIAPTVLTSVIDHNNVIVLNPNDADNAEVLIRNAISSPGFGQIGGLALWAQTGKELINSKIIRNTYSDAYELGIYVNAAMENPSLIDNYFINKNQLIFSFDGTLLSFEKNTDSGFDSITLKVGLDSGKVLTIKALNENLILYGPKNVLVTAPHLISYLIKTSELEGGGYYLPYNNGDEAKMASFVGNKIYVTTAYAERRLYSFDDTFLSILKDAFNYRGPVTPPIN